MKVSDVDWFCCKLYFRWIINKYIDEFLGDCFFFNICFYMDICKYVYYEIDVCMDFEVFGSKDYMLS